MAKFAAVARTLKTTEGERLDVLPHETVDADLDQIDDDAEQLRDALTDPDFTDYEKLGLFTDPTILGENDVPVWQDGELPVFETAPEWDGSAPQGAFTVKPDDLSPMSDHIDLRPFEVEIDAGALR